MKYTLLEILSAIQDRRPGALSLKQMKTLATLIAQLTDEQLRALYWAFRDED